MLAVATDQTEVLLQEIAELIEKACSEGDNVSAIATRANVPRPKVSKIRNMSFDEYPSIETLSKIAKALGYRVSINLSKS